MPRRAAAHDLPPVTTGRVPASIELRSVLARQLVEQLRPIATGFCDLEILLVERTPRDPTGRGLPLTRPRLGPVVRAPRGRTGDEHARDHGESTRQRQDTWQPHRANVPTPGPHDQPRD